MKRVGAIATALVFILGSTYARASRTVRDELGRDVITPDTPTRIVCLAPSITDTVFALGAGQRIVGITDYTKYPPEAASKPSVGGVINPSLEKVASLNPDLVLAIADLNSFDVIRSLERLGVPVFVIHPHGIEDIYQSIENIGKAINKSESAATLIQTLRNRANEVHKRVAGKYAPSVFFLLWADPVMSAGKGAFITELIEIAGGRSITRNVENEWPTISLETLLAQQPEYVLLVRGSGVDPLVLQKRAGWQSLNALKKGHVLYVDDRIEFPSPLAFDALEELAKQLHP